MKKITAIMLLVLIYASLLYMTLGITGCSEGGLCGNSSSCGDCGCENGNNDKSPPTTNPTDIQEDPRQSI